MTNGLRARAALLCLAAAAGGEAGAQVAPTDSATPSPPPISADSTPPQPGYVRLAAGTPVRIEIAAQLSSKTARIDDWFPIRLTDPIDVGGVLLIPAGAVGKGQIVHAAKARALGKPGELILAARFIACGDNKIELRSFRLGGDGRDNSGLIVAGTVAVGVFAAPLMFVSGGEMIIPARAGATAKVKTTIDLPATIASTCASTNGDAARN